MSVLFTRRGPAPASSGGGGGGISGTLLSDLEEGSIVLIPENGVNVEFYVAKQDYESGLNGSGRTLLVRKDCYDVLAWHSASVNAYAESDIDSWLNDDYKSLLDADIRSSIGTTKFYYTPGNGNNTVTTLERDIFMLSLTELGQTFASYANTEGTVLPNADIYWATYCNGDLVYQWTRTPYTFNKTQVYNLTETSGVQIRSTSSTYGIRPCFTLPSNAVFDPDTMEFVGVAA